MNKDKNKKCILPSVDFLLAAPFYVAPIVVVTGMHVVGGLIEAVKDLSGAKKDNHLKP